MNPVRSQQFHDDLRAAIAGRVPLEVGDLDSAKIWLSATKISQLEQADSKLPERFVSGLEVYERLELMSPIFESYSLRPLTMKESKKALSRAWWYTGLFLVVAYCGLYLFASGVAPMIAELRADVHLNKYENKLTVEQFLPTWPVALPFVGIGLLLLFAWAACGGIDRWTLWLGGRKYLLVRMKQSAINTAQLLTAVGLPVVEAMDLSCRLLGLDAQSSTEVKQLAEKGHVEVFGQSDYLQFQADRLLSDMKHRTPVTVISVVGCLVGTLYAVLTLQPVFAMLVEIGRVNID